MFDNSPQSEYTVMKMAIFLMKHYSRKQRKWKIRHELLSPVHLTHLESCLFNWICPGIVLNRVKSIEIKASTGKLLWMHGCSTCIYSKRPCTIQCQLCTFITRLLSIERHSCSSPFCLWIAHFLLDATVLNIRGNVRQI